MAKKEKLVAESVTFRDVEVTVERVDIIRAVRKYVEQKIPKTAKVLVTIPTGGDRLGERLEIDQIVIRWQER